jgi:hypothetical protein
LCGLTVYTEYVSLQRDGYARMRAEKWWFAMGGEAPVPITVREAIERKNELGRPLDIAIYRNNHWWNVSDRRVRRHDRSIVEIDRNFNTWVPRSREAAFEAMKREPMNDMVPF